MLLFLMSFLIALFFLFCFFSVSTSKLPGSFSVPKRGHHQHRLQRWPIDYISVLRRLRVDWTPSADLPTWKQQEVEPPLSSL